MSSSLNTLFLAGQCLPPVTPPGTSWITQPTSPHTFSTPPLSLPGEIFWQTNCYNFNKWNSKSTLTKISQSWEFLSKLFFRELYLLRPDLPLLPCWGAELLLLLQEGPGGAEADSRPYPAPSGWVLGGGRKGRRGEGGSLIIQPPNFQMK